jgi:hypothetical protein
MASSQHVPAAEADYQGHSYVLLLVIGSDIADSMSLKTGVWY